MPVATPHFLLLAESRRRQRQGDWRFVLQTADGRRYFEADDAEPRVHGERLELLAVVRGLEALDEPAQVTVVTGSEYVSRGLNYGLDEWRTNNWQWERHGEMVPVKNGDLWRRLDHALNFHTIKCRLRRFDAPHGPAKPTAGPKKNAPATIARTPTPATGRSPILDDRRRLIPACRRWLREKLDSLRLRLAQIGSDLLPRPWLE